MNGDFNAYPRSSALLHWLTALLLAIAFGIGLMLEHPPAGWGDALYRLHWSFGLTVLALTLVRVVNRAVVGAPPPHPRLTPFERWGSRIIHSALYVLLIVVPLLGWLGKSAYGGAITVFGLFDVPALGAVDEGRAKTLLGWHKLAIRLLLICLALHLAAAINHAFIKKDGVMARMWRW